jgi:branched-chain amino acid transport system permease protein
VLYREAGQFKTNYAADMAIFPLRQDRIALAALLTCAFVGVPLLAQFHVGVFGHDYIFKAILIPFLILALATIGLNILVGYCGQISLGAGAFMAIGAYSAYKFGTGLPEFGLPPLPVLICVLLGGLIAALVGIMFGIPSLRIKGLYLAVATLAAQFFFDWVFLRVKWFTNYTPSGSVNSPSLNFFGWSIEKPITFLGTITLDSPMQRYLVALTFVTAFACIAKNLVRGNLGRQWMAIRDMDIAAEIMGIRPLYAKLTAFAISSFFIGVAGALWAFVHLGSWEPLAFSIDRSFQLLFMVIIGGLGSILGSFLGTAFILILPIMLEQLLPWAAVPLIALSRSIGWQGLEEIARHLATVDMVSHLTFIVTGSLICYLLIVEPHGFARLWVLIKEKLRLWPFPY